MKLPKRFVTVKHQLNWYAENLDVIPLSDLLNKVCEFSSRIEDDFGIVPENSAIQISLCPYEDCVNFFWRKEIENPNFDKEMEQFNAELKLEKERKLAKEAKAKSQEDKIKMKVMDSRRRVVKRLEKISKEVKTEEEKFAEMERYLRAISKSFLFETPKAKKLQE